jgi:tetratricopeptide (TPR) repeat protein/KaiC/GvpD/RAD55 family RecA-like ATPase
VQSSKLKVFAEPILVGREQELSQLNQYLESTQSGKGSTVFISGEAGSGKSKLAKEFLNAASKKGITILSGWCLSDAAVPYFPFVAAFDSYFGAMDEEPLSGPSIGRSVNLVPNFAPATSNAFGITAWLNGFKSPQLQQVSSPQVWKDQVFSAVGKTLHTLADQAPIIFFMEDMHWADSASLALLHYISRIIPSERIMLLATFRSEELTADVDGRPHPLAEIIRQMKREDIYSEIRLSSLSKNEIKTIFTNMLGGNPQPALVEKLSGESHGNALFLIESLRMLTERKSLIQDGDNWRLAEYEMGIPSKVKDIILRRLGILKFNQRRVLDAASVIGEKFDIELLGSILNQDNLELLETINFIARSTSLVFSEGNCYQFNHAKSRETIYGEIPVPLKRGYHNRIAERLEASSKQDHLPLSDLAYHYAQAENKEKALKFALAAAEDEYAKFSNSESMKHFKFVLDNLSETQEQKINRLKAMEGLGDALHAMSCLDEAEKVFDVILKLSEDPLVQLRIARKSMLCSYWLGNIHVALAKGETGDKYGTSDSLEYARLKLQTGFIKGRAGRNLEAIKDMEQALRVFERQPSLADVAQALVEINFTYRMVGRLVDSFSCALRAVRLFTEFEDLRGQGLAISRLAGPFIECGLFQEALNKLAKAIEVEAKVGDYNLLALHYWSVGQTQENMRNYKEAIVQNAHAIEIAEKTDGFYVLSLCYAAIMGEYALVGNIPQAEEYDQKLSKLFTEKTNLKNNPNSVGARLQSKIRLLAAKGELEQAYQISIKVKENLQENFNMQIALWKKATARLLFLKGKTEEAEKLKQEFKELTMKIQSPVDQASLQFAMVAPQEIDVGEDFNLRFDFVSLKKPITLLKINGLVSKEFKIGKLPPGCSHLDNQIEIHNMELKAFSVEPLNFSVQVTKPGEFILSLEIEYTEGSDEIKHLKVQPFPFKARSILRMKIGNEVMSVPIIPNRVNTGFSDLDTLLFGGIPEGYSVILASPSIDERELLIKRYLETGAQAGEITYYLTSELNMGKTLAEKYPQNFQLIACSALADSVIKSQQNVFKLKGVENLTEIDIALTKTLRSINPAKNKRICIDIVSDVLLQHHALITRKWLSGVLPLLKNKGFTVLVVINPQMHPQEEAQAIQGLFEGEIRISEKETNAGPERTIRIRRLYNQKYLENEITLKREKLE